MVLAWVPIYPPRWRRSAPSVRPWQSIGWRRIRAWSWPTSWTPRGIGLRCTIRCPLPPLRREGQRPGGLDRFQLRAVTGTNAFPNRRYIMRHADDPSPPELRLPTTSHAWIPMLPAVLGCDVTKPVESSGLGVVTPFEIVMLSGHLNFNRNDYDQSHVYAHGTLAGTGDRRAARNVNADFVIRGRFKGTSEEQVRGRVDLKNGTSAVTDGRPAKWTSRVSPWSAKPVQAWLVSIGVSARASRSQRWRSFR